MIVWLLETDEHWAVIAAEDPTLAIEKWIDDCDFINPNDITTINRFDLIE